MVRIVRPTLAPATPASETHPPRSPVPSLLAVYETLRSKQGPQHWWPGSGRLEIIVGAILTQNTAWRNVEQALHGLSQQRLLSIPALRTVPLRELETCVRPSGYFRQKARKLKAFVSYLDERHAGSLTRMSQTPTAPLRSGLLGVWGIGPETADCIALEDLYGAQNYHPLDVVITRGEGVWVTDVEGRKYLDCLSAYSALHLGHCHPRLIDAMQAQARRLTLTSRAFRNDRLGEFYRTVCGLTGYEMALPMNTGAEAVETAIKAARKWGCLHKNLAPDTAEIIVCANNFHGRTTTIVGFSSEPRYRDGFGPFAPGFVTVPFGDADALREAITPRTVAFLFEPIQGEAGVVVPPDGYLRAARDICAAQKVLLAADEIQTGLGRTGSLFACGHENVVPDILILGKALAGGFYPVSVVLASRSILGVFRPGDHGSTFGGNPLGAAVATEALRALVEEGLVANAAAQGAYFQGQLARIPSPHVATVRGRGLLIGVELRREAGGARRFCEALARRGILCKETHDNVIRFAPPLVVTRADIDWALERIADVLCADDGERLES